MTWMMIIDCCLIFYMDAHGSNIMQAMVNSQVGCWTRMKGCSCDVMGTHMKINECYYHHMIKVAWNLISTMIVRFIMLSMLNNQSSWLMDHGCDLQPCNNSLVTNSIEFYHTNWKIPRDLCPIEEMKNQAPTPSKW
jgi:hypothetical protein